MNKLIKIRELDMRNLLVGRRIIGARYMTEAESRTLGFYNRGIMLLFDNGTIIFPSIDEEGNDAGTLFGQTRIGDGFIFSPVR